MRKVLPLFACVAAWAVCAQPVLAQSKKIDLRTKAGAAAVKGQWRYHDVKIVEVVGKNKDGSAQQDIQLRAKGHGA